MPEELAPHLQRQAQRRPHTAIGMPQIMRPHARDLGALAEPAPDLLRVGHGLAGLDAGEHQALRLRSTGLEDRQRWRGQVHGFDARLGVRQPRLLAFPVDPLPAQRLDFPEACARQEQKRIRAPAPGAWCARRPARTGQPAPGPCRSVACRCPLKRQAAAHGLLHPSSLPPGLG